MTHIDICGSPNCYSRCIASLLLLSLSEHNVTLIFDISAWKWCCCNLFVHVWLEIFSPSFDFLWPSVFSHSWAWTG